MYFVNESSLASIIESMITLVPVTIPILELFNAKDENSSAPTQHSSSLVIAVIGLISDTFLQIPFIISELDPLCIVNIEQNSNDGNEFLISLIFCILKFMSPEKSKTFMSAFSLSGFAKLNDL